MIHAGQQALFQNQNQRLLGIRQAEMDYFNNFYTNFATQSALLLGFAMNTMTNVVQIVDFYENSEGLKEVFFVSGTFCFCTMMHTLLCSVFVIVFAPNLALHGPLGSMVRAVDGMVSEQDQIFLSFILSLVFFTINTVVAFWFFMSNTIAWVCAALTFVFSAYWYKCCLRIYNRFKMHANTRIFEDDIKPTKGTESVDRFKQMKNSLLLNNKNTTNNNNHSPSNNNCKDTQNPILLDHMDVGRPQIVSMLSTVNSHITGYMSFRLKFDVNSSEGRSQRKFFVLNNDNGSLLYYKSERTFNDKPERPDISRPIILNEYSIECNKIQVPYRIVLTPIGEERATWEFTLDTAEEITTWSNSLERFCRSSISNQA